jgi:hypothetical protein
MSSAVLSCGSDAERRYAGLSKHTVSTSELGYRIRYLSPPWERVDEDPLVSGSRKSVPVGSGLRDVVKGSAAVIVVPRQSNLSGPDELSYAKLRLEVAAVQCTDAELSVGSSCAQWLADTDFAQRIEQQETEQQGNTPRTDTNDFDQAFYELMTRDVETSRYRRIAYFETAIANTALRVYFEGNPDLSEAEITAMLRAFEVLRLDGDAGHASEAGT